MIPGFDLVQFFQTAGSLTALLVVACIIFAESGLFVGFFLPGDSILFTLGFLLQTTSGSVSIHFAVFILFIAAVLGDNVGYISGRKIGPRLFNRKNSFLFKQENVQKAQEFYEANGSKTIVLARFIPIVRTFVPIVAGVGKMEYKTFLMFNMLGGALWTAGVSYLGYFLGKWITGMGIDIETVILPIVALIVFISVAPAAYHLLKDKKQRTAIWNATKLQCQKLVNGKKSK